MKTYMTIIDFIISICFILIIFVGIIIAEFLSQKQDKKKQQDYTDDKVYEVVSDCEGNISLEKLFKISKKNTI